MKEELNYIEKNKASWNNKTDYHINSDFYDMANFLKGKNSLNDIEVKLLVKLYCIFNAISVRIVFRWPGWERLLPALTCLIKRSVKQLKLPNN